VGRSSRGKKNRQPAPEQGFTPELTAQLQKGLSREQLADPKVMRQLADAIRGNPVGTYMFTEGSAPGTPPASALPAIDPAELAEHQIDGTLAMKPSQVIDLQARLQESLARRDPAWARYMRSFMSDALERNVDDEKDAYEKWGVMFQPARTPQEYCGILAKQLAAARTYQVTSGMVDVVDAVYQKTASQAHTFQSEDVPWPAGFAYLDRPLSLKDYNGREVKNRALSWNLELARFEGDKPGQGRPAVRIVCWSGPYDEDYYWDPVTRDGTLALGGLSLAHSVIIPFGVGYRSIDARHADGVEADDVSRWLHALWLMLESEVPALRRAENIDRHAARRALRSLNHKDVTVVTLRRTRSKELDEGEPGHRDVDWTHRWVVQGFWRHARKQGHHAAPDQSREHCIVCDVKVSWVRPHLRGPSDLPLQVKPQLYKLAR
jgi:hypothetical protein